MFSAEATHHSCSCGDQGTERSRSCFLRGAVMMFFITCALDAGVLFSVYSSSAPIASWKQGLSPTMTIAIISATRRTKAAANVANRNEYFLDPS